MEHPRVREGVPPVVDLSRLIAASSPPTRGCSDVGRRQVRHPDVFPADALHGARDGLPAGDGGAGHADGGGWGLMGQRAGEVCGRDAGEGGQPVSGFGA